MEIVAAQSRANESFNPSRNNSYKGVIFVKIATEVK